MMPAKQLHSSPAFNCAETAHPHSLYIKRTKTPTSPGEFLHKHYIQVWPRWSCWQSKNLCAPTWGAITRTYLSIPEGCMKCHILVGRWGVIMAYSWGQRLAVINIPRGRFTSFCLFSLQTPSNRNLHSWLREILKYSGRINSTLTPIW